MIDAGTRERQSPSKLKVLVDSRPFNLGIVVLIFIGAVTVGLGTYPDVMSRWGGYLALVDWIIIGSFAIEIVLRITAESPKPWRYFGDPWNVFDFVIVALCLLPLSSDAVIAIRVVRLLRMLRIFRALPKLRLLIRGIAHSISSVGYVATLLLMHFFLFAVAGVSAFSTNDAEHFGNLGSAFLTLFQVLTLENWPDVMAPVKAAHPTVGVIYFVGFIVTGTMVVMNLFVGVIVGGMSEAIQEEKGELPDGSSDAARLATVLASLKRIEMEVHMLEERIRLLGVRSTTSERTAD